MAITTTLALFLAALPAGAQELSTSSMRQLSLGEAYSLAAARSEQLLLQADGAERLAAAERELAAAFRPELDFQASASKQQNADAAYRGLFAARYNVFSGMRDYMAAKAAQKRTASARFSLERARQSLYYSAAAAFLGLQTAQREAAIRAAQLAVTGRRIDELEARSAIGRSRRSEVVSARAQLAQDKAALEAALGAERLAQQALKFLTGLDEDLAPRELPAREAPALGECLSMALRRPDLEALRRSAEAADFSAELAELGGRPSVDLSGNLYVLRSPRPNPENNWDAQAALKIPLYTGGQLKARAESARSDSRSARTALELARRQAYSEVRSAFDDHAYALRQAAALAEALRLAEENARFQQEDYKLGLVTNLDVLSALNTAQQTRLALAQAQGRAALALIRLETAAGAEVKP